MKKIPQSASLYKAAVLFLAGFLLLSFVAVTFDYHDVRSYSTCAICHAKTSLNGAQYSFIFLFYPTISHYKLSDELFKIRIPVSIFINGRAPPESA